MDVAIRNFPSKNKVHVDGLRPIKSTIKSCATCQKWIKFGDLSVCPAAECTDKKVHDAISLISYDRGQVHAHVPEDDNTSIYTSRDFGCIYWEDRK